MTTQRHTPELSADRSWTILVHGYGAFEFRGSREAAEEVKAAKCRWENASGRLWASHPVTEVERLEAEVGREFIDHGSCAMATINRLAAARQHAAA
ncbi:MAG: hypothetical protein H5U14_01720 [Roseovarius sp.]|nr:hypothetical protein [Roseovarius sp.]